MIIPMPLEKANERGSAGYTKCALILSVIGFAVSMLGGFSGIATLVGGFTPPEAILYPAIFLQGILPVAAIVMSVIGWKRREGAIAALSIIMLNLYLLLPLIVFLIDY